MNETQQQQKLATIVKFQIKINSYKSKTILFFYQINK